MKARMPDTATSSPIYAIRPRSGLQNDAGPTLPVFNAWQFQCCLPGLVALRCARHALTAAFPV